MAGTTKADQVAELKTLGVSVNPSDHTQAELQDMIDAARRDQKARPRFGSIVLHELNETEARAYNRERDGLSRFLKASRGGPLPSVRVSAGDVVPVIVNGMTDDGALCGNAQMPGGGVLWVDGFEPHEED